MRTVLKVYVSSTFGDLKEHRQATLDAIMQIGAHPVAIEAFGAASEIPVDRCREEVRASDVVVLLVAHRYGAIPRGEDKSYTELEFNFATEALVPVLAFLVDEKIPWPPEFVDRGEPSQRLSAFKRQLRESRVVDFFTSPSDLALRVTRALYGFISVSGRNKEEVLQPVETVPERRASKGVGRDDALLRIEGHLEFLRSTVGQLQAQVETTYRANADDFDHTHAALRPASFLGPMADQVDDEVCFVAMPYSRSWSESLEETLVDICKIVGLKILIAKNMDGRFIPHDIWQGITSSGVIIADVTDGNPNVAYEIGLADVLGKEVVLLCQGDKVPFDFLGQRLICYEDTMKGAITLREELTARLRQVIDKRQRKPRSSE